MKHKMLALILALTVASWAQTATPAAPESQNPASTEKAKCACCDKMASADTKGGKMSCPRHASKDGKEAASCCGGKDSSCCAGKDAKSCMKDSKGSSCCKDCGKDKMTSACSDKECKGCSCAPKHEKAAKNCCPHEVRG